MKRNLPVFLLLLYFIPGAKAQYSLQFSIRQLPPLVVNAGKDSTVAKGSKLQLGGPVVATGGSGNYTYRWAPADGLDNPALERPTATIDSSITYSVIVDDGIACKQVQAVNIRVSTVPAVTGLFNQSGLQVYPNPSNGSFYLRSKTLLPDPETIVAVHDLTGRVVFKATAFFNQQQALKIVVANARPGIYLLRVRNKEQLSTFKLFFK